LFWSNGAFTSMHSLVTEFRKSPSQNELVCFFSATHDAP
jgi:hypothetical protein